MAKAKKNRKSKYNILLAKSGDRDCILGHNDSSKHGQNGFFLDNFESVLLLSVDDKFCLLL